MSGRLALGAMLFATGAILSASGVLADEASGCAAFKPEVLVDQLALAAPTALTGDRLEAGAAVRLPLRALDVSAFEKPPERAPRAGSYGAILHFSGAPDVYRLSLAEAAWVDVLENGASLHPIAFAGAHDCPHLRKSLSFRLSGAPVTLQISNAEGPELTLILSRENFAP